MSEFRFHLSYLFMAASHYLSYHDLSMKGWQSSQNQVTKTAGVSFRARETEHERKKPKLLLLAIMSKQPSQ